MMSGTATLQVQMELQPSVPVRVEPADKIPCSSFTMARPALSAGDPCLASSDDACGSGGAFASELTLEVSAGNSYLIQVGAWNGGAVSW